MVGAHHHIAGRIGGQHVQQGFPTADVVPAQPIGGDDGYGAGTLHDTVVQGSVRRAGPRLGQPLGRGGRLRQHLVQGRQLALHLRQEAFNAPHKHARVPGVLTIGQHGLGLRLGGFLLEALGTVDLEDPHPPQALTALDIAKTGRRESRRDAEGDQVILPGHLGGGGQQVAEAGLVADEVVGRQAGHHRLGIALLEVAGGQPNGRRRAARGRLQNEVPGGQLRTLAPQIFGIAGAGDHANTVEGKERRQALYRNLKQGALAQEFERLLGPFLARQRPQPGSTAPGHNDSMVMIHQCVPSTEPTGPPIARAFSRAASLDSRARLTPSPALPLSWPRKPSARARRGKGGRPLSCPKPRLRTP